MIAVASSKNFGGATAAISQQEITMWTEAQQSRMRELCAMAERRECTIAYWNSDAHGRPANGGTGTNARPGLIETVTGPLELCGPRALHATLEPHRWKGLRVWVVALHGEIIWDGDKCGALTREIIGEVMPEHAWDESVGARLGRKDLVRANLWGANLRYANLRYANLVSANLVSANLWGANLWGANLRCANLESANLVSANLGNWERDPETGYARRKRT